MLIGEASSHSHLSLAPSLPPSLDFSSKQSSIVATQRAMELFASEYVFLYCSIASFVTIVVLRWLFSHDKIELPPGPRRLPIIGNLGELIGTHPHVRLMNLAQKYGPLMYLKLGQRDCIVASSPEMAKEFLKNQDANFCGRPHVMQAEIVYQNAGIS